MQRGQWPRARLGPSVGAWIDPRDSASLQPRGRSRQKSRDGLGRAGGLKFFSHRFGNQNPFEQFRQDVLEVDENEVVEWRGVGDDDLGYASGAKPDGANHRNGTSAKTVLTDDGAVDLDVPRDRAGTFEPVLIPKHERRFTGFDDNILALYARGLTVREIQGFLREMYAVDVSPDLISTVTDALAVTLGALTPIRRSRPQ